MPNRLSICHLSNHNTCLTDLRFDIFPQRMGLKTLTDGLLLPVLHDKNRGFLR